jgi:long-chain fatty acid transport protein
MMRKIAWMFFVVLAGIAALSRGSIAAGFRLPDQDAAAMGMASAFVGQADNPSAVWYNPAGITNLDGVRMSAGVEAIYPVLTHNNTIGSTDVSDRTIAWPAEIFATDKVNDRVSLGLGIDSPFGLSTDWSAFSPTSHVATLSRVKTIDVNPNVALKINDALSAAVGLDFMKLQATLQNVLSPTELFVLNGEGTGLGANAALLFKANEQLNLGLSYRSRIKVTVDGNANVVGLPFTFTNSAQTDITLPDLVQFGASYKASDRLTVNTDLEYTWWSTYDRLVVQSNSILVLTTILGLPPTNTSVSEKDWKNTWALRIGGQYKLSDQWKVRAGYVYDQSPVPSDRFETSLPDADRQGVTIGAGYAIGNITVDASYMYLWFKTRTISNSFAGGLLPDPSLDGTYTSSAQVAALTVGYKF